MWLYSLFKIKLGQRPFLGDLSSEPTIHVIWVKAAGISSLRYLHRLVCAHVWTHSMTRTPTSTCLCILSAGIKSVHHLIFIFIIFIFKVSGDRGRHSVLTSSLHTIHTQIHAYTHIRVDISWHAFRPAERERCSHRKTWCFPWGLREERCKQTITGMCSWHAYPAT